MGKMEQIFVDLDADRTLFSVGVYHPAELGRFGTVISGPQWEVDTLEINGVDILGLEFINFELIETLILQHIQDEAARQNQELMETYA